MTNLQPWQLAEFMYQMGMATSALIELEAMKTANAQHPDNQPYTEEQIRALKTEYGMECNPLVEAMRRINQ